MKASYLKESSESFYAGNMIVSSACVVRGDEEVMVSTGTNHIICIDVSGSMYDVIEKLKIHLKSKLVDVVDDDDTVTILAFNHDVYSVSEMISLSKVSTVRELNEVIDSLHASGMTDFYGPLEAANNIISNANNDMPWNLFFMSDGCHNGCSWDKVVSVINELSKQVTSSFICEYGYYADTNRLNEMSCLLGGSKIFSEGIVEYNKNFDDSLRSVNGNPKIPVDISIVKNTMKYQFVFYVNKSGSVVVQSTERLNEVLVPYDVDRLMFIRKVNGNIKAIDGNLNLAYPAIYALLLLGKYDDADKVVRSLGDKELINAYCNAYGKQRLNEFNDLVMSRINRTTRATEFVDPSYKSNDRRYCVLDLIDDLELNDSLVLLNHEDFKYNRISTKTVVKPEIEDKVKMTIDDQLGYSMSNLVRSYDRANLSIQVNIPVTLEVKLPDNTPKNLTIEVPSSITRNYSIIRDGILNIDKLPVEVNSKLAGKFKRMGIVSKIYDKNTLLLDLTTMPITNRRRVMTVNSNTLSNLELEAIKVSFINKYLSYAKKRNAINEDSTTNDYNYYKSFNTSIDVAKYLVSLGITKKGYNPKVDTVKSGDEYLALFFETKLEKFSNIPKIEDVLKKRISKKPFTISEKFMDEIMNNIDIALEKSDINTLITAYKMSRKSLLRSISEMKMSLLLSRRWFADKNGFDDDSVVVNVLGENLNMKFSITEKVVSL